MRSWRSGALALSMALVLSTTSAGIAVDARGATATPTSPQTSSAQTSSAKRTSARRTAAHATSKARAAAAHAAVVSAPAASVSAGPQTTAAVAGAGAGAGAAPGITADGTSPVAKYAADPAAVKRGRQVFVGSCGAYCHSTHDEEREAPSLFDCTWRHGGSDAEIFASIATGYTDKRMPGWKGVLPQGDDDIWRVIAFLRSASTCKSSAPASASAPATPAATAAN